MSLTSRRRSVRWTREEIVTKLEAAFGDKPYTLQEAGDVLGITRERVRQLEVKLDFKHRRRGCRYSVCYVCGDKNQNYNSKRHQVCKETFTLVCSICQTTFSLDRSQYTARFKRASRPRKLTEAFCSKPCFGKWLGQQRQQGQSGTYATWYAKRIEAELCVRCGKQEPREGFRMCVPCTEKTREYQRAKHKESISIAN